jgi:hypothetical protein
MVTCPWCGTSYTSFQPNCSNCGGPLPSREREAASATLGPMPPGPPRAISDTYAWRLMWSEGWSISALVFMILGTVFSLLGGALTIAVITAFVGIPFLLLGIGFLLAGGLVGSWRHREARRTVEVLRAGQSAEGRITGVDENLSVSANSRHPWRIAYSFELAGQEYQGAVSTLKAPGPHLKEGSSTWVLYLPNDPRRNVIYPHP